MYRDISRGNFYDIPKSAFFFLIVKAKKHRKPQGHSVFFGRNVSKEKTVDNCFFKAKSTECEQSESRLAQTKLCDTRMDGSGFSLC